MKTGGKRADLMPRIPITDAADLMEDHSGTFCESCGASAEEGSRYCHTCGSYWKDVDDGLFSDQDWED